MRGVSTLIVCSAVCSFASAQLFDWENIPNAGVFPSVSQTSGGITATATGHNGVVTVVDWSTGPYSAVMAPFGARSLAGGQIGGGGLGPIRIDFSMSLSAIQVQFGDGPDDDDGIVTFWAYSSSNVLLDQESFSYGTTSGPRSMTLTGSGISYIVGDTDGGTTPSPDTITYDNMQVTPVPEPSSVAMLATGAGILITKRKKRNCDDRAAWKMQQQ